MITIRNYIPGEPLPAALATGYEGGQCDPRWIWIAALDDAPVAVLVAAPAHVTVILMRLIVLPAASAAIAPLLRHALDECNARGYLTYVTWVDPSRPVEASLLRIVRASGGMQIARPQVACVGITRGSLTDILPDNAALQEAMATCLN